MSASSPEILLVEDNPDHAQLMCEAFRAGDVPVAVTVVEDGLAAMAYLRREGRYADARRPDLVLLDINLPRKDGREVLGEIKADSGLSPIPVLVLTTSGAPDDVAAAYRLHANSYLLKPFGFTETIEMGRSIYEFWFRWCTRGLAKEV